MKAIISIVILALLTSCGQGQNKNGATDNLISKTDSITMDTSSIAIIKLDSTNSWLIKNSKPSDLTIQELAEIEKIIERCLSDYNIEQKKQFEQLKSENPDYDFKVEHFVIEFSRYRRQYIPTINSKGEKEVWINCFCRTYDRDWRKELIIVEDGGNCYFNLKVNLTTNKCFDLMVNGNA